MTTYTTSDLATRVLRDLGLTASDETLSGPDYDFVVETIRSEVALLEAKGISIWNGSDYIIPQEYLTVLSRRIGIAIAPAYGLSAPGNQLPYMEASERDLRIIGRSGPTYRALEANYF